MHFFTNRVVSYSLPNVVVDSDFINCFKSRLDKFWNNQDVLYNRWEADWDREPKFMFTTVIDLYYFTVQSIV